MMRKFKSYLIEKNSKPTYCFLIPFLNKIKLSEAKIRIAMKYPILQAKCVPSSAE